MVNENTIDIQVETVTVESKVRKLNLTVRNTFYVGFKGKIMTIWIWFRWNRDVSFKEYLDRPVPYQRELIQDVNCYHDMIADKELIKILEKELNDG